MKPLKKASEMSPEELGAYIDQSVLKPEFTQDEIKKYTKEGIDMFCRTVCVNPSAIDLAKELCAGTKTDVCVVCDFPFGLSDTDSKVLQAEAICKKGDIFEIDTVSNYGWIRSGLYDKVEEDIRAVSEKCHEYGTALKVILETDALTEVEIVNAVDACVAAGADFVKTSTGFFTGGKSDGACEEVIRLMLDAASNRIQVKGSGGIRTQEHFFKLIDMGIDRMGIGFKSTPTVLGISDTVSSSHY